MSNSIRNGVVVFEYKDRNDRIPVDELGEDDP